MNRAIVLAVSFLFAAAAFAQQYKWVDQDGKVRYGDTPPPGVKATPLKPPPRSGAPSAPAASAGTKDGAKGLSPDAAFRKRQEDAAQERERQAKADQNAQVRRENCTQAQDALRTLESGQRISRADSKGERYYLDESQVAQETVRARQTVREWCG